MTKAKSKTTDPPKPDTPTKPKGWVLEVPANQLGKTGDRAMAELAADGIAGSARSLVSFGAATFGELSLTECVAVLRETAQGLNDGDLSAAVTILAAQAVALNAMFGELARVGQANMFKAPDYADRYLRLAFKAQGQSRATLETLAAIKNPPVVFARQANIANGPQQVNNGSVPSPARTRVGETQTEQSKLLEAHDGERLDTGAQGSAGRANQDLAPLGTVHGAAHD